MLDGFDLVIPAGSSLAIVGQNGAGKTTLAKLLCRLYDPQSGAIRVDSVDIRHLDIASWRSRLTAVFQDFIKFERPLRNNVAPAGARTRRSSPRWRKRGVASRQVSTRFSRAAMKAVQVSPADSGSASALTRALRGRERRGRRAADEPTAQLDVRQAEIFERILTATRKATTILISHRFSTVRQADRICVLEHGKVIELGSHDELMARGGRYKTMFDLQAQRFNASEDEEGQAYDVLA